MTTYFVSPSGNNSNNGTSSSTPWLDTTNVNTTIYNGGDSVLFQGGQTISGAINIGVLNWASPQKWSLAHINADVTLSNNNLTATHTAVTAEDAPGFATNSFTTGKFYWETVVNGVGNEGVGIGNTSTDVGSAGTQYLGKGADSVGYYPTGFVFNNSGGVATWAVYSTGNRICHALDLTNGKYWTRVGTSGNWNNNAAGDPTNPASAGNFSIPAGVTAVRVVPGFNTNAQTTDSIVAFFSASSWVGTPPTGFGSMDVGTTAPSSSTPVTFGSYGTGQSTINPGTLTGFAALDIAGIVVSNLIFTTSSGSASGIQIINDQAGNTTLDYLLLQNLTISGFGSNGIIIFGSNGSSGFSNITISGCSIHDNTGNGGSGSAGIVLFSVAPAGTYAFFTVLVTGCNVFNNTGTPGTSSWSGGGIAIGQCSTLTVTLCHTYNNGALNNASSGPVGVLIYVSSNVVCSFCESDHNHTNATHDGDGFNVDGGILEYCYSHDNDGIGALIDTYLTVNTGTIRYCIFQNNNVKGVANGSEINLTNYTSGATLSANVHNNTVYSSQPIITVSGLLGTISGNIANNIFYSAAGSFAAIGFSTSGNPNGIAWNGNDYFTTGTFSLTWNGTTYTSFATWKSSETQETVNGGFTSNPSLVNPGGGGTIGGYVPASLGAYRLNNNSPMINAGINLNTQFSINPGPQDYYGDLITSRPSIGAFDPSSLVGAAFSGSGVLTANVRPQQFISRSFVGSGSLTSSLRAVEQVVSTPLVGVGSLVSRLVVRWNTNTAVFAGSGALAGKVIFTPLDSIQLNPQTLATVGPLNANAVVGAITVITNPPNLSTVQLSLSGPDAGSFALSSTSLPSNLLVGPSNIPAHSYNITITATIPASQNVSVVLSGSGILTAAAAATTIIVGGAAFTGGSTLTADARPLYIFSSTLSGSGSLVTDLPVQNFAVVSFLGSGNLTASVLETAVITAIFVGSGNLSTILVFIRPISSGLVGNSALSVTAVPQQFVGAAFTGLGLLVSPISINFLTGASFAAVGLLSAPVGVSSFVVATFSGGGVLLADVFDQKFNPIFAVFTGAGNLLASGLLVGAVGAVALGASGLLVSGVVLAALVPAGVYAGSGSFTASLLIRVVAVSSFVGSGGLVAKAVLIGRTSASFAGTGQLVVDTSVVHQNQIFAAFSGIGSFSAVTVSVYAVVPISFSSTGSLSASILLTGSFVGVLVGSGILVTILPVLVVASASFNGSGSLLTAVIFTGSVQAVFSGASVLTASASPVFSVIAALSGLGALTAGAYILSPAITILVGAGGLTVPLSRNVFITAVFVGTGLVSAVPTGVLILLGFFNGQGSLSVSSYILYTASSIFIGSSNLVTPILLLKASIAVTLTGSGSLVVNVLPPNVIIAILTGVGGLITRTSVLLIGLIPVFTGSGVLVAPSLFRLVALSSSLVGNGLLLAGPVFLKGQIAAAFAGNGVLGVNADNPFRLFINFVGAGMLVISASLVSISAVTALLNGSGLLLVQTTNYTGAVVSSLSGVGFLTADTILRQPLFTSALFVGQGSFVASLSLVKLMPTTIFSGSGLLLGNIQGGHFFLPAVVLQGQASLMVFVSSLTFKFVFGVINDYMGP